MAPTTSTTCPTIVLSTWRLRINFADRSQELAEAKSEEEETEAIALRDAIFREARAQGPQPTSAVLVAPSCDIGSMEVIERRQEPRRVLKDAPLHGRPAHAAKGVDGVAQ